VKPAWQVERALKLSNAGWNNCQIARELDVNQRTASD
jgi:orotate phosphoribosyltransferase-like protein